MNDSGGSLYGFQADKNLTRSTIPNLSQQTEWQPSKPVREIVPSYKVEDHTLPQKDIKIVSFKGIVNNVVSAKNIVTEGKSLEESRKGLFRFLNYTLWDRTIIILALVTSVIAFISALFKAFPVLLNILVGVVPVAYAGSTESVAQLFTDYATLKDFVITLFVMIICTGATLVCLLRSKDDHRSKYARDLTRLLFGFIVGKGFR